MTRSKLRCMSPKDFTYLGYSPYWYNVAHIQLAIKQRFSNIYTEFQSVQCRIASGEPPLRSHHLAMIPTNQPSEIIDRQGMFKWLCEHIGNVGTKARGILRVALR